MKYAFMPSDFTGPFGEAVRKDCYGIKEISNRHIDFIIDIGASVGVTVLLEKFIFPTAKIIAVEPHPKVFECLKENTSLLDNIYYENVGIGDGSDETMIDIGSAVINMTFKDGQDDELVNSKTNFKVHTMTLTDIFKKYKINQEKHKYIIKYDCEGCEKCLLMDKASRYLLSMAELAAVEVHFKIEKETTDKNAVLFRSLPTWGDYNKMIHKLLDKTHDVEYVFSNGKRGYGIFKAIKK